jgi:hypothetical protein
VKLISAILSLPHSEQDKHEKSISTIKSGRKYIFSWIIFLRLYALHVRRYQHKKHFSSLLSEACFRCCAGGKKIVFIKERKKEK